MAKKPRNKQLIAAKVAPEIREWVEKLAKDEERTVSQTVSRLLTSHPARRKTKVVTV